MPSANVYGSSLAQELRQTAGAIALRALYQNQSLPKFEDELVLSLRSAFVDIYRLRSTYARLPTELWVHIWRPLPLVARVAVSQVCFLWRTIALSSAELWDKIEIGYCPLHPTFPDCLYCNCHILRGLPLPALTLNLLPLVLPRSQQRPLSLRLVSNPSTHSRIMALLAGALHRLAKVEIDAVEIDKLLPGGAVTAPFCSLHSLRELRLTSLTTFTRDAWPENADLSSLEHLHASCVTFRDWAHAPLPNLTSLHFTACTLEEILGYLQAAPRLSELSLDVRAVQKHDHESWTPAARDAIRQSVSSRRLSRICVTGIPAVAKQSLHDMFHIASCPDISFRYRDCRWHDSFTAILQDAEGLVSLSLTTDEKKITVRACGDCGRIRQLELERSGRFDSEIEAFFRAPALSTIAVHSLSLDYLVFTYFMGTLPWSSTIEALTLYLPAWPFSLSFKHPPSPESVTRYEWSRLATLTFEAPNDGYVVLPDSAIQHFVRFFSPDGKLEKLVLRGVYAVSDAAYEGLARTIIPDCRLITATD